MTVAVLALDAADYRLLTRWGCDNILLDRHNRIESISYGGEKPHTLEVWPTVATGLHPRDHGISPERESTTEWASNWLNILRDTVGATLPVNVRHALGRWLIDVGMDISHKHPTLAVEHLFDATYMWPGLTAAEHLGAAWDLLDRAQRDEIGVPELERELFALAHDEVNWVTDQEGLIGVHCHVLDAAGHAHCRNEPQLQHYYERMDYIVGSLRTCVDGLVVISDHGMQVSWLDDTEPGVHSDSAMFSSTFDAPPPDHVMDVADWLRSRRRGIESAESTGGEQFDVDRGRLEDLGYI